MTDFQRVPPHDIEAETVVLGSMILHDAVIPKVSRVLIASDFYRSANEQIFNTLVDMVEKGVAVDLVTIRDALVRRRLLEAVGGIEYVADITEGVPSSYNWSYYADIVLEMSRRRDMISKCAGYIDTCYDRSADLEAALAECSDSVYMNAQRASGAIRGSESLAQAMRAAAEHADAVRDGTRPPGLRMGFENLDKITGGMRPGELIIIAGRPSGGKTAMCTAIGLHVAANAASVLMFSREMLTEAIGKRALQVRANVRGNDLKFGTHSAAESESLTGAIKEAETWRFHVDSTASTVGEIGAIVRQKAREWGQLDLVIVDYLQLLGGPGDSRAQQIGRICWGLKQMAISWECPLILLSQFDRAQNRSGGPPSMFTLKESGDIENNADMIFLLWYSDLDSLAGEARRIWVQIDKHRDGGKTFWPVWANGQGRAIKPIWQEGALYLWLHLPTTMMYYEMLAEAGQEF